MKRKLFYLTLLPLILLSITGCNLLDGDSNSAEEANENSNVDSFDYVNIQSSEWYTFNQLAYFDYSHFISMSLGSSNGITLTLVGDTKNYDITSVKVYAKSKKPSATTGIDYSEEWPRDSHGICERSLYIKTGFVGYYGFTAHISNVWGSVKPFDKYLKDKENNLWQKIEEQSWSENGTAVDYSFCGRNETIDSSLFRLPEKADNYTPTRFGANTFDVFGFKNVKTLIIPKNYTKIIVQDYWKDYAVEDYYYEGNENDLTTNYYLDKKIVKIYRETEPNPEVDSGEYAYWHYVDGKPQIW